MPEMKSKVNQHTFLAVLLLAAIDSTAAVGEVGATGGHPAPMNVVLITLSSLRADHVSCLGYHRDTTPHFDKFAKANTVFRNAYATSSWMMPAHGSIFTSLYPSEHGATHINKSLGDEHLTLAEILTQNGYYCAGFCCGPRLTRERGFAQGFHVYDDFSVPMLLTALELEGEKKLDINQRRTNDLVANGAIRWLHRNTHRPFFLFVHYYDTHWDYLPPEPCRSMYDQDYDGPIDGTRIAREPLFSNMPVERDVEHILALYDGEVRQTDEDLGVMLRVLADKGLFENSIVMVMGDHGEQFYEHGNTSHHGLYEELIRIPWAISLPGGATNGRIIDGLVSQVDILPTILDFLQIPVPDACRGKSCRPLIEGRVEPINELIFTEYTGGAVPDSFAVHSAGYKCFQDANGDVFAYDLARDPGELRRIPQDGFNGELQGLATALRHWIQAIIKGASDASS